MKSGNGSTVNKKKCNKLILKYKKMQENTRGCTILGKTVPGEVWDGRETWRRMMMGNCSWEEPGLAAAHSVLEN